MVMVTMMVMMAVMVKAMLVVDGGGGDDNDVDSKWYYNSIFAQYLIALVTLTLCTYVLREKMTVLFRTEPVQGRESGGGGGGRVILYTHKIKQTI